MTTHGKGWVIPILTFLILCFSVNAIDLHIRFGDTPYNVSTKYIPINWPPPSTLNKSVIGVYPFSDCGTGYNLSVFMNQQSSLGIAFINCSSKAVDMYSYYFGGDSHTDLIIDLGKSYYFPNQTLFRLNFTGNTGDFGQLSLLDSNKDIAYTTGMCYVSEFYQTSCQIAESSLAYQKHNVSYFVNSGLSTNINVTAFNNYTQYLRSYDIRYIVLTPKGGGTNYGITNLDIWGISSVTGNQLPDFNYSLDTSQCINESDTGMKYYFNYTCSDPEGDTCYYALVETSNLQQIYKQTFEDSVTYFETAPKGDPGFFNSFLDWIVNSVITFKIPIGSQETINIYNNKTIISDCVMEDGSQGFVVGANLYSVNNPYTEGKAMYSDHCRSPVIFPLGDIPPYAVQSALSFEYIIPNESQFNYTQTIFRIQDSTRNDIMNLSIIKDWISNNVTLQMFGTRYYNQTLDANYFQVIMIANKTNSKFKYSVRFYNTSTKAYTTFYNSTEYNLGGNSVPKYFMSYPVDYAIPNAYYIDNIFLYSTLTFGSWSPNLNNYFTINNTKGEFNLYVSDSVHYQSNIYNTYKISFNLPFCQGSGGVLPDDSQLPPNVIGALGAVKDTGKIICQTGNVLSGLSGQITGNDSMPFDLCIYGVWIVWLMAVILGVAIGSAIGMFIGRYDYMFSFSAIGQLVLVFFGHYITDFFTWQIILSGFFFAFGMIVLILGAFNPQGSNNNALNNNNGGNGNG